MYEHLVQNIEDLSTFMVLQSFFGNYVYITFISVFLSQEILTKKIKLRIYGRTKINNKKYIIKPFFISSPASSRASTWFSVT